MQISLGLFIGVAVVLALIVGIITHFVTVSNLRKNAESKIGNAEAKAREIIDDAVKTAETTKKESLLEVKEESIRTKNELEKETKEERSYSVMRSVYSRRKNRSTNGQMYWNIVRAN